MTKRNSYSEPNESTITIKKYSNRRLYSLGESKYITLDELENLIKRGHSVLVIDSSNKKDITSEVLLQILIDRDKIKNFPSQILMELICSNELENTRLFDQYLKQSFTDYLRSKSEDLQHRPSLDH